MEILRSRLVGRKTETPDQIEKRTKRAFEEMQYQEQYDYVVVNDDLQQAVQQVIDIIEK